MNAMKDEPATLERAKEMIEGLRLKVMDYEEQLAPLQQRVVLLEDRLDVYELMKTKAQPS